MKKFFVIALAIVVALVAVSCASTAKAEEPVAAAPVAAEPAAEGCKFAGEYYVVVKNQDGEEFIMEEFVVDADGRVHGATEGSGMTGFEGTVNEDGSFTVEYTRLGGTGKGQFDGNGNVTGESEVRGRTSTFTGSIL